jgi:Putative restriction endonuclease
MASTVALVTLEDYLATNHRPDREWIDGKLKERNVGKWEHARVQALLAFWLGQNEIAWGVQVGTGLRMQVSPRRIRIPDVVLVPAGAQPEILVDPPVPSGGGSFPRRQLFRYSGTRSGLPGNGHQGSMVDRPQISHRSYVYRECLGSGHAPLRSRRPHLLRTRNLVCSTSPQTESITTLKNWSACGSCSGRGYATRRLAAVVDCRGTGCLRPGGKKVRCPRLVPRYLPLKMSTRTAPSGNTA